MGSRKRQFKSKVLIPILAIFTLSVLIVSFISYRLLDRTVGSKTDANLDIFTDRVMAEIKHLDIILNSTKQTLNEKHIAIAKSIEYILDNVPEEDMTPNELQRLAAPLDIIELNIANSNGILTNSSVPQLIGFDYKAYEITKGYMALTSGALTEISEEPRRSVLDENEYGDINHYTGVVRKNGGFIQLGFNAGVIGRLQDEISISRTIRETKIGENGYGLVLSNGIITAHPNEALHGKNAAGEQWYKTVRQGNGFAWVEIDEQRYYAGFKNMDSYTVAALVPENDYYKESRRLLVESALMLILSITIIIPLMFIILSGLLRPVKHLVHGLEKIAEGDFTTRIEGSYNDEFDEIKDAVNNMAQGIENLFDEQKEKQEKIMALERDLVQKQISIMLSQIRPHFLYNSLVVIRHLCRIDPKLAEETVVEFSEYLRGNLDSLSLNEPILFEKELRHVETYLNIEKKRFGDKLIIKYDIKTKDFLIPALTLQPIVENAVRYGVTKKENGGTVEIRTEETEKCFLITVIDDGVGFELSEADDRSHIGIENTRSRLAAFGNGKLEIHSKPGKGTTAVITIPK